MDNINSLDWQATEFALAFLMPEDEYRKVFNKNTLDGIVNTKAIAEYFHVSIDDAALRGIGLGLIEAW